MTLADRALLLIEELRLRLTRVLGTARYRPAENYFEPSTGDPTEERYFDRLERINDDFVRWIDPGRVGPPSADVIDSDGETLTFPSACPIGVDPVDRVVLRVYPSPENAPPVGVLFHHWMYLDGWGPVDYLLKPLAQKLRVAAMVAPHHMMRRAPGDSPGEGLINPNVMDVYAGLRQWQADHAACVQLLRRDHGFSHIVLLGYSLGGYGSLLARLFGPRLPTVAVCVTNRLSRGIMEGVGARYLVQRLWEAGFSYDTFTWATRSLHLALWAGKIRGEELTWMHARHDRIEPRESLEELIRALRPERLVELPGGHATAALFRERIGSEVLRMVGRRLEQTGEEQQSPPWAASG